MKKNVIILKISLIVILFATSLFSQEYAFIYISSDGSGTNTVGTTWTNVGDGLAADFVEGVTSANWSYSSNVLTAASDPAVEGLYCLKYSLSFNAGVGVWDVGISIDGADPVEPIFKRSISNTRKDAGNVSGILMINVTQGQTIEMVVKSDQASADFAPSYAQLVVVPAAQNPTNYFGGMHISSQTSFIPIGTTSAQLTGFSTIPEMSDWTFSSNTLTAGTNAAGLYYVSYSVSFTGDGGSTSPEKYIFELVKNDGSVSTNIFARRSTSDSDIGNISAGGLVSIAASDVIKLYAKAEKLSSSDLIIEKATVSLYKLADTSPNSYAGMSISSDQTISVAAVDTWTTIGAYSLAGSNDWNLSSNILTLTSTSAYGDYYIEYSTSLSTANTGGDDVELGVFIGTHQHPEMTVKRRLSSNTDVGAVCGVGIFNVDGPDSTISLKIKNVTSGNNLTIKKSLMGFSQIRYVASDTPLPILLAGFEAKQDRSQVILSWETASEVNNAAFLIFRNDVLLTSVEGAGTSSETHAYTYTDKYIIPGMTYTYLLADLDYDGQIIKHVDLAQTVTIGEGNMAPEYLIGNTYPNPFNPTASVPLNLAVTAKVDAQLYDLSGKLVQEIFNGTMTPGSYDLKIDGKVLNSGIYFIKIMINDNIKYSKVTLLK